jgi:cysteine synthase A
MEESPVTRSGNSIIVKMTRRRQVCRPRQSVRDLPTDDLCAAPSLRSAEARRRARGQRAYSSIRFDVFARVGAKSALTGEHLIGSTLAAAVSAAGVSLQSTDRENQARLFNARNSKIAASTERDPLQGITVNTISDIVNDNNFVKVNGLGLKQLYMKIEALNPAGSIKMKTALGMIRDLELRGRIDRSTILIESSSGSLGVALAVICAERGYRFTCVVDPNTSLHNVKIIKALGASVVVIDKRDENGGFLASRISYITELVARDHRYLWLNQYANPENPRAHARTTAFSIFQNFDRVDYLFIGAGTTGTLMGCIEFFGEHSPRTKIIAVDTIGSVTFGQPAAKRYIPGIGTSRRPEIFSPEGIHAIEMIAESDAISMCRHLARNNGILAGGSTGTVLCAVQNWKERIAPDATVVMISPDFGERYLDTIYDDDWVRERFGSIPTMNELEDVQSESSLVGP